MIAYAKIGVKILSTTFIRQDQLLVLVGSMCLSNTYYTSYVVIHKIGLYCQS